MDELMFEFENCLNTWTDLPDYVYTEEYEKAFMEFAEKRLQVKKDLTGLAIHALHHETGNRMPYFEFKRD